MFYFERLREVGTLCEKFLSRFDGMCFCKGIASAESVSLSELFVCIYGEAQDNSKPGRERQIALLRNSGSSRAFELFAKNLRGVEAYPKGSIGEAVTAAIEEAEEANTPVVCLGSLYTYGDVIAAIKKK